MFTLVLALSIVGLSQATNNQTLPNNPCATNLCLNAGTCSFTIGNGTLCVKCTCPSDYTGLQCETKIDVCSLSCQNGGICIQMSNNSYACECNVNFTGSLCQTPVALSKPCDSNPCLNDAKCVNYGLIYNCECNPQYTGYNCEFPNVTKPECPCLLNGKCEINANNETYCVCDKESTGKYCEIFLDSSCVKCKNGGTCYVNLTNYEDPKWEIREECLCAPGFTGVTCETSLDACNGNGQLIPIKDTNESYCICNKEWTGAQCDIRVCFCKNNGKCMNDTSNVCSCPATYTGKFCEFQVDADPCVVANPCLNDAVCVLTYPFYPNSTLYQITCKCKQDFTGSICETKMNTTLVSICELMNLCENGATCIVENNLLQCICPPGFWGIYCERRNCSLSCENGGKCLTLNNKSNCECPEGFSGELCQYVNVTNPCLLGNPCKNGGTCLYSNFSLVCSCQLGYYGPLCEYEFECEPSCQNSAKCKWTNGTLACECSFGFFGKSCEFQNYCLTNNPCMNNATCQFKNMSVLTCECPLGYTGLYCEISQEMLNCSLSCQNGGTCMFNSSSKPFCVCSNGFFGDKCEKVKTHFTINCPETASICKLESSASSYCEIASPCGKNATCIDLPFDLNTNTSHVCLCKNNATFGFSYCNQSIKDLLPLKNDDQDSSSSEEDSDEMKFFKTFNLKLKFKDKKSKFSLKFKSTQQKRPCYLDMKVNLTKNYCSTQSQCQTNSNSSVCIDLPISIRLKSNVPYMCVCNDTQSFGYPYCTHGLSKFKEINSGESSLSEENQESGENFQVKPKLLKKFFKKFF